MPHRIDDLLAGDRYQVSNSEKRNGCCDAILKISTNELEKKLEEILHVVGDEKKEKTLKYQLKDWIIKIGYICENQTYWEYMRKVFQEIVCHNIRKAAKIQMKRKMILESNLNSWICLKYWMFKMKLAGMWKRIYLGIKYLCIGDSRL